MVLSNLPQTQEKEMDKLNLFIDTIRNTLYQPSGRGTSLLCSCLMLTAGRLSTFSGCN